jgi:hypothetical protein
MPRLWGAVGLAVPWGLLTGFPAEQPLVRRVVLGDGRGQEPRVPGQDQRVERLLHRAASRPEPDDLRDRVTGLFPATDRSHNSLPSGSRPASTGRVQPA